MAIALFGGREIVMDSSSLNVNELLPEVVVIHPDPVLSLFLVFDVRHATYDMRGDIPTFRHAAALSHKPPLFASGITVHRTRSVVY